MIRLQKMDRVNNFGAAKMSEKRTKVQVINKIMRIPRLLLSQIARGPYTPAAKFVLSIRLDGPISSLSAGTTTQVFDIFPFNHFFVDASCPSFDVKYMTNGPEASLYRKVWPGAEWWQNGGMMRRQY